MGIFYRLWAIGIMFLVIFHKATVEQGIWGMAILLQLIALAIYDEVKKSN